MARLIALYSSTPQAGKSTVADYLVNVRNYRLVKFADTLKSMVSNLLWAINPDIDWVNECMEGRLKAVSLPMLGDKSPRDLMISLGTAWGREMVDPEIWVVIARVQAFAHLARRHDVVIDDMRFPNEYHALEELAALGHRVDFIQIVKTGGAPDMGDRGNTEGLLDSLSWSATLFADTGDVVGLTRKADDFLGYSDGPEDTFNPS